MKKLARYLVMLFVIPNIVWALDLDEYRKEFSEQSNAINSVYIAGVGAGYSWANSMLVAQKQSPFYCQPDKLTLIGANYVNILNKELEAGTYSGSDQVEMVLLFGLIHTFPCQK